MFTPGVLSHGLVQYVTEITAIDITNPSTLSNKWQAFNRVNSCHRILLAGVDQGSKSILGSSNSMILVEIVTFLFKCFVVNLFTCQFMFCLVVVAQILDRQAFKGVGTVQWIIAFGANEKPKVAVETELAWQNLCHRQERTAGGWEAVYLCNCVISHGCLYNCVAWSPWQHSKVCFMVVEDSVVVIVEKLLCIGIGRKLDGAALTEKELLAKLC